MIKKSVVLAAVIVMMTCLNGMSFAVPFVDGTGSSNKDNSSKNKRCVKFEGNLGKIRDKDQIKEKCHHKDTCDLSVKKSFFVPSAPAGSLECEGKLKALVLKYIGGNCSDTDNWQSGKVMCHGDAALTQPVRVVIKKNSGKIMVFPDDESIMIGDQFSIISDKELNADTEFDIVQDGSVLQSLKIHTSCSKPLLVGDRFGSVQVVAMDLKDGRYLYPGTEVEYTYVISNTGDKAIYDIVVDDSVLGPVPGSPISLLAPGEHVNLSAMDLIDQTTTNFVTVSGKTDDGDECSATDSATVMVTAPPTGCMASGKPVLKIHKKKTNQLEWVIYNESSSPVTVDTLTLGWPESLGMLKRISIGNDVIFNSDDGISPPFATIDEWNVEISKRQIKANHRAKLKFGFEKRVQTTQNQYTIMVNFLEGCSVEYAPGQSTWECAKPIDSLTMIWDGDYPIRIKAWKGVAGSILLADIDNIAVGDKVTVGDYAGSPNDVFWEIFEAGTDQKVGESKFHMSCSDPDMNGPEDCGKAEGDGKTNNGHKPEKNKWENKRCASNHSHNLINRWLLAGMADRDSSFDCYEDQNYVLTVNNGSGDGSYPAGTLVIIKGDEVPSGQEFDKWVVDSGDPLIDDVNAATTTLTMPAEDASVTATYKPIKYELTVIDGSGSGLYESGATVEIVADKALPGQVFAYWEINSGDPVIADTAAATTTLTMPVSAAKITAVYTSADYSLTVNNGSGDGNYKVGTVVTIAADDPPYGYAFDTWEVVSGNPVIFNVKDATTNLTMMDSDVLVTATYVANQFALTVNNGSGSGTYAFGEVVTIVADPAPEGQEFDSWIKNSGDPLIFNAFASTTTLTMENSDATVTASYTEKKYTLVVNNGSGGGRFTEGWTVRITASPALLGKRFDHWQIDSGNPDIANINASSTDLTMGGSDAMVTAIYVDEQ